MLPQSAVAPKKRRKYDLQASKKLFDEVTGSLKGVNSTSSSCHVGSKSVLSSLTRGKWPLLTCGNIVYNKGPCTYDVHKVFGDFDPLPPCLNLGPIHSTKYTQPPLLHLLLGYPLPPPTADVICTSPLRCVVRVRTPIRLRKTQSAARLHGQFFTQ